MGKTIFNTTLLYCSELRLPFHPLSIQKIHDAHIRIDGAADFICRVSMKSEPLNARSFYLYLRYLENTYLREELYCHCSQQSGMGGYLDGLSPSEDLAPYLRVEGVRYIAYPFVFKGKELDHMVLIWLDLENRKIYYYDPQGLASDDPRRINASYIAREFNLRDSLEELSSLCKKIPTQQMKEEPEYDTLDFLVIENEVVTQSDLLNCGTHVLYVLEQLYKGCSMNEAIERAKAVDMSRFREEMAQQIRKTNVSHAFANYTLFCSQVRLWSQVEKAVHEILTVAQDSEPCLNLSRFALSTLPSCINELTQLVRLVLKDNCFTTLPCNPADFPLLQFLDLRENPLLAETIDKIEQLKGSTRLQILYSPPTNLELPPMLKGFT